MAKIPTITECPKPPKVIDLIGRTFGQLTVKQFVGLDKHNNKYWNCQCDCGNTKVIAAKHFIANKTQSCGCVQSRTASERAFRHGESSWFGGGTVEYSVYSGAKRRCNNPHEKGYKDYGERGIEFRYQSFEEFLADVGRRPSPAHSIDRIDTNGHYEPKNVKWSTTEEQNQNRRNTRWITANGRTECRLKWSRITHISDGTLRSRQRHGWCDHCTVNILPNQGTCAHKS